MSKEEFEFDYEAAQKSMTKLAEDYLEQKFPGVDKEVFYRDYSGFRNKMLDIETILSARDFEKMCESCNDRKECLVQAFLGGRPRPILHIENNRRGQFFHVNWSSDYRCKFEEYEPAVKELLVKSNLTVMQQQKTFESFDFDIADPQCRQIVKAKTAALHSAKGNNNLILAGKRGTGKTHLAIAICLYAIKNARKAAIFEVVPEMLDKIRRAIFEHENYFALIDNYKNVPVLVLDDLGKEKQSDAARDYLFQIIDYRYRHELQTIITTNAFTPDELASWPPDGADFIIPIISRLLENGKWVAISKAPDKRCK